MVIPDRAAKLYERTWDRFNEMLSFIPTMTLRSLCRDSRVNYCGMQEWMAQHGYAEPERADTGKGRASDPIGTSEENPTFLQLNPVPLPQSMAHDILRQVSITFSEGTVLTLQECSPQGAESRPPFPCPPGAPLSQQYPSSHRPRLARCHEIPRLDRQSRCF